MSNALIIFIKNPVIGKVKTRLATTLGSEKALAVYQQLLAYTRTISELAQAKRFAFYSDFTDESDDWNNCQRCLQTGDDLGEKMSNAFKEIFGLGYIKAVIIGSDCLEITEAIIRQAFEELNNHDIVIGPATDGGYYLLGMKQLHQQLFINKSWSTANVLQQTLDDIALLNLNYQLLPVLNDIDNEQDLIKSSLHV